MKVLLSLSIDQKNSLKFSSSVGQGKCFTLHDFYGVSLQYENRSICLKTKMIGFDFLDLADSIQGCLELQRYIPSTEKSDFDLGLLWHYHWQKVTLAYQANASLPSWSWLGDGLYFIENKSSGWQSCMTWLYNDFDGKIVMQVNTIYPWFFAEACSKDLDISYDEWLPNYKILYKAIISKDVAEQWLKDIYAFYAKLTESTACRN